ncbi:hypothetical protein PSECIP111854_04054 [Pseudoalteromonas sp. CIP111854]|uniref:Uncharacterized protein n=1 Tax=Pseudoalteromonas holothuriae TaxID=2963714 RepID=A0A9W4W0A1_9GAMM|nr:hypothetical protein [Pseudoalteromonas sp. CIP111854]CAH9067243.1 hypothetical protein PSECIP111854_04054 [Pseudoalteromonas sp. CIP111854]
MLTQSTASLREKRKENGKDTYRRELAKAIKDKLQGRAPNSVVARDGELINKIIEAGAVFEPSLGTSKKVKPFHSQELRERFTGNIQINDIKIAIERTMLSALDSWLNDDNTRKYKALRATIQGIDNQQDFPSAPVTTYLDQGSANYDNAINNANTLSDDQKKIYRLLKNLLDEEFSNAWKKFQESDGSALNNLITQEVNSLGDILDRLQSGGNLVGIVKSRTSKGYRYGRLAIDSFVGIAGPSWTDSLVTAIVNLIHATTETDSSEAKDSPHSKNANSSEIASGALQLATTMEQELRNMVIHSDISGKTFSGSISMRGSMAVLHEIVKLSIRIIKSVDWTGLAAKIPDVISSVLIAARGLMHIYYSREGINRLESIVSNAQGQENVSQELKGAVSGFLNTGALVRIYKYGQGLIGLIVGVTKVVLSDLTGVAGIGKDWIEGVISLASGMLGLSGIVDSIKDLANFNVLSDVTGVEQFASWITREYARSVDSSYNYGDQTRIRLTDASDQQWVKTKMESLVGQTVLDDAENGGSRYSIGDNDGFSELVSAVTYALKNAVTPQPQLQNEPAAL